MAELLVVSDGVLLVGALAVGVSVGSAVGVLVVVDGSAVDALGVFAVFTPGVLAVPAAGRVGLGFSSGIIPFLLEFLFLVVLHIIADFM